MVVYTYLFCVGIVGCLATKMDTSNNNSDGGKHSHESFTNILNELLETYEQRVRPGVSGMFGEYSLSFVLVKAFDFLRSYASCSFINGCTNTGGYYLSCCRR